MRVLVTGATGFIGRHLVRRLVSLGEDVACLVRDTSVLGDLDRMGVEFRFGDMRDPASLRRATADVDVVYHLAAVIRAVGPDDLFAVNEGGTANLAASCAARTSPPTLVVVSSIAAAGPSAPETPHVEGDPLRPISDYGRSKAGAERAARARAGAVPTTIVRPPVVFGEHDLETLELFRVAARGWHIVPTLREHRVSLLHASDLAHLLQAVADAGERLATDAPDHDAAGVYYAAYDEHPTFAGLGPLLAEAVGQDNLRVVHTPPSVTWGLAAFTELAARVRGKASLFNLDKAREATAGSWTCSADKAAETLGVRFRVGAGERLKQTADWYRRMEWL